MSELLAGLAALAPGVAIRASLLVAVGYGVASALGGRSAALRHLVWSVALGAAAAVPLLQMALPAVEVAILPASVSAPRPASNAPVALPAPGAPLPAAARVAGAPAPPRPEIELAAVWLLGMLALSVRLAGGVLRVWWLERRAAEVTGDAWVRLTDALSRRLKLGRIVTLLRAEPASVPMTWGVFRPVVALPAQSAGWDEERRTVVLAHELAHVRRRDHWVRLLELVVTGLYW